MKSLVGPRYSQSGHSRPQPPPARQLPAPNGVGGNWPAGRITPHAGHSRNRYGRMLSPHGWRTFVFCLLSNYLTKMRECAGLSQRALGDRLALDATRITRIE